MFSIGFTDEPLEYPYDDPMVPAAPGRLVLGKSTEEFLANLSLWSKLDYELHWTFELNTILEGNHKAALIVSYDDPRAASNMEIWRVYRDGEYFHFQNQIVSFSSLPANFEISELSRYIQDRVVLTVEGNKISEWDIALQDVEIFLRRSKSV